MEEITVAATIENIVAVTEFVDARLEAAGCSMRTQMQIDLAIDELVTNVASYAYAPGTGDLTVQMEIRDGPPAAAVITFIDGGVAYDPTAKEDPDITLSAEERQIGGLGILLVKKTMDDVRYERKQDKNVLQIIKNL